jgi:hypothetical protein
MTWTNGGRTLETVPGARMGTRALKFYRRACGGYEFAISTASAGAEVGGTAENRTPISLEFSVALPFVTATGRWRERGRMGRGSVSCSALAAATCPI